MIHFKKVRFRNLLSYGQMWTEIQLDRSPSTMVLGKNGSGKSSVSESLCFGLFGKPYRKIKKGNLINIKNNRDLLVEVEFEADGVPYMVRRGQKPDIFEIYKDGELLNQPGSSRDYQHQLEQTILKMDYQAACQIIFVGKAQHTTFMQLDAKQRRQFVEVMLNLVVFSNMSKLHSQKFGEMKNKLQELKTAVMVSREKLKAHTRMIDELEEAQARSLKSENERITQKLEETIQKLTELEAKHQMLVDDIAQMVPHGLDEALADMKANVQVLTKIDDRITQIETRLEKLGQGQVCYTCGQSIDSEAHETHLEENRNKHADLVKARLELSEGIHELEIHIDRLRAVAGTQANLKEELGRVDSQITMYQTIKKSLEDELNTERNDNSEVIQKAWEENTRLLEMNEKLEAKYESVSEKSEYMGMIGTLLSDKGIKSMLIKRFIPIINQSVNNYLTKLGLFARFTLDESFDETIQSRGIDTLSYHNFSEGEKLRMDMAILLAWRDIARLQGNVSTNLLILDEVADASMDTAGMEAFTDVLELMENLNVFIVTHTPEKIADKVRSIIKIEKQDGFSKIVAN